MRAAICYEAGKPLVVEDGVTVDAPARDEVKVKVAVTAICHSDIHAIRGERPVELPGVAGHEVAGHIEEVGEDVTAFRPGDPVIVGTVTAGCGYCYYCTVGLRHLCENLDRHTSEIARRRPAPAHHINKHGQRMRPLGGPSGGFSEFVTVTQDLVAKVPETIPLDRAALLACGVTSGFGAVVNRAHVEPYSSVVVVGTGGVGMNAIQGAAFSGAHPVIAVDVLDNKLEMAKKFGATHTVNVKSEADPIEAVKKLTYGRGADYVFVTVGSIDALRQGFLMSRPRGMTVAVGVMQGTLAAFAPMELLSERILTGAGGGSIRLSIDIPMMVDLYLTGRLKLDELISGRYSLDQVNEAIESVERGEALRNLIVF